VGASASARPEGKEEIEREEDWANATEPSASAEVDCVRLKQSETAKLAATDCVCALHYAVSLAVATNRKRRSEELVGVKTEERTLGSEVEEEKSEEKLVQENASVTNYDFPVFATQNEEV
jgi:hypothetical protein